MAGSLFFADLQVPTLKAMLDSAAPFCKQIHLALGEEGVLFHGTDPGSSASIVGVMREQPETMGTGIQVTLDIKSMAKRISELDPNTPVVMEIEPEGKRLLLNLRQHDTHREVTIMESDVEPVRPELEPTGSATLDTLRFSRVVSSLKDHSDIVQLEVLRSKLAVTYKTSREREGWVHPCTTHGKGTALFGTGLLAAVSKAAAKVGKVGTLHVGPEMPLRYNVVGEALIADLFLGHRSMME